MKQQKCRLCGFEHGLSEAHVFTRSYSTDGAAPANEALAQSLRQNKIIASATALADSTKSNGSFASKISFSAGVISDESGSRSIDPQEAENLILEAAAKLRQKPMQFSVNGPVTCDPIPYVLTDAIFEKSDESKSGGRQARRAKASGPVTPVSSPEKMADEAAPPINSQVQSAEPSRETDYPVWRKNYLRLKAEERRRARALNMTIFEYRDHLAKATVV